MNLEQIDQLLGDWKTKIDLVSQNLIDLHGLPSYQRLVRVSGFPKIKLTGVKQARITPVLEAISKLFQHFDLLVTTLSQAVERRKQVPCFLGSEQKIREIEDELATPFRGVAAGNSVPDLYPYRNCLRQNPKSRSWRKRGFLTTSAFARIVTIHSGGKRASAPSADTSIHSSLHSTLVTWSSVSMK